MSSVKHYQIIPTPNNPHRPAYQIKRKTLSNPAVELIGLVVLIIILLAGGYMHVRIGF